MEPIEITSEQHLREVLGEEASQKLDTGSKNIRRLWQEIVDNDCVIALNQNDVITRYVRVGSGIIQAPGNPTEVLLETYQRFKSPEITKRIRERNNLPAGKIHVNEPADEGFLREMREELGLVEDYEPELIGTHTKTETSRSYRGLLCHFEMYYYKLELKGHDIKTEYIEDNENHEIRFEWRPIFDVAPHFLPGHIAAKL